MGATQQLLKGDTSAFAKFTQQWYVDVQGVARLCVIGLLDPAVKSDRIFAFAKRRIGMLRKLQPNNKNIPGPPENQVRGRTDVIPSKRAEEFCNLYRQSGWSSIAPSIDKGSEEWCLIFYR